MIGQAKTTTGTPVDILADADGTVHTTGTANPSVSTSVDPGHNILLNDTAAHQGGNQATTIGYAEFSAPFANTAPVYLAKSSAVTTGTGLEIMPGISRTLPCANTNEWFAITGTATQNVHVVAL